MTPEESVIACIAVCLALIVVALAVFKMWLTTGDLASMRGRIAALEQDNTRLRDHLDEWQRFKQANDIDDEGVAHPWKVSVFHKPSTRRTV